MPTEYISPDQARAFYAGADTAHDFEHILRVMRMGEYIAQTENANAAVVRAAALLHDIGRADEDHGDSTLDHAEVSAREAADVLRANGADDEFANRVADAIRAHRFRGTAVPTSLEGKILFDADKLDAIGAIGIARAYAVCGARNQKLYSDPNPDLKATRTQQFQEHTPVDEFHAKLKHLKDRFYTPTAQQIAAERHAFMVGFFEQLGMEVHGEK